MTRDSLMLTIPLRVPSAASPAEVLAGARELLHHSHATDVSVGSIGLTDDNSVENETVWNVTYTGGKKGVAQFAIYWAVCIADK